MTSIPTFDEETPRALLLEWRERLKEMNGNNPSVAYALKQMATILSSMPLPKERFRMRIEQIFRLRQSRVCLLECHLEHGAAEIDAACELAHGDERFPMRIKGVALDGKANPSSAILSVSIDVRSPGLAVAAAGDYIVGYFDE